MTMRGEPSDREEALETTLSPWRIDRRIDSSGEPCVYGVWRLTIATSYTSIVVGGSFHTFVNIFFFADSRGGHSRNPSARDLT